VPRKLQDLDIYALLEAIHGSTWTFSDILQWVQPSVHIHAQPCLSVQLCIQGLGDSA
jgi:hypothetical protein